jgi:Fe2+ transport system protein FeoA
VGEKFSKEIPLNTLGKGEHAFVTSLPGGRAVSNRLVSLGFTPGVKLDMVQNFGHGPLIVALRGTRVALGRGEAAKIMVRWEAQ